MAARDWDKLKRQDKARKKPLPFWRMYSHDLGTHQPTKYELASGLYPGARRHKRR